MKTKILFIVSAFFSISALAQTDTTNTAKQKSDTTNLASKIIIVDSLTYQSTNKVEISKDTIVFQSEKESSLKAKGVGSPESAAPAQNLISGQLDAGRTTGVIDISPTGAATYSIPIAVPPGINGVAPQIALVYNSQGGNGVAGFGWNISGLSAVTRIPSTRFHDNKVGGINGDADDRFALDGQRLILKSGTYGGDGAEYQTENYSNIKIISRGVSAYGANYGPNSFEVFYPDGSKAYYGGSYDALSQLSYAISYTENSIGARINYYYVNADNRYLSAITYGGLGTNTPINQINFIYETPSRVDQAYIAGVSLVNTYLLKEIKTVGNGIDFRHYFLTYDQLSPTNYQRLISVQEASGDETKNFSPINFSYDTNSQSLIKNDLTNLSLSGINQTNCKILTEDFNGDGKIDFIISPNIGRDKVYTFFDHENIGNNTLYGSPINLGYYDDIFAAKLLSYTNKVFSQQGIVTIQSENSTSLKFQTYVGGSALQPLTYQYEKIWDNLQGNGYYSSCTGEYVDMGSIPKKFLSGDFNGDGLTDIISITKPYQQYYDYGDPNCNGGPYPYRNQNDLVPIDPGQCCVTSSYNVNTAYVQFINLDRRLPSNFVTYSGSLLNSLGTNDQLITADFNGDGKTDILHIVEGKMVVYSFDENNYIYKLWETPHSRITTNPLLKNLIGDFNGDGKTDIFFPISYTNPSYTTFAQFISTGKGFDFVEKTMPFKNSAPIFYNGNLTYVENVPVDFNGDGKTDVINIESYTHNGSTTGDLTIKSYINTGIIGSQQGINFTAGPRIPSLPVTSYSTNLIHYPVPVFLSSDQPNYTLEFGIMSDKSLKTYKFGENLGDETRVNSVNQDGVIHNITYNSLDPSANTDISLYEYGSNQVYPFTDIQLAPGLKVVSKLTRTCNTGVINQIFGYGGAVSNLEGLGFLGFKKIVKSNWYTDDDYNRLYSTTITDPQLRGAVINIFTSKYPFNNLNIQNASVVNDNATLNDYITRTDYTYQTNLTPEKVFTNLPTSVMTKDLLNGTNTSTTYNYDSFNNVTKEFNNLSGAGTKTSEITYDNSTGSNYYIGRPLTKKTTVTNANDSYSTEEQYTYTGYLPTQVKKKGNGTDWIIENMQYDAFGNVTRKGITAGGVERATTMQYDATGRFMTQSTDLQGLQTNFTYDSATGNLLSKTDPFGFSNTQIYDSWGRLIQATDFLGVNSYTTYENYIFGAIKITNTDDEGNGNFSIIDALGNKTLQSSRDVIGQWVGTAYLFDSYDRPYKQSEPAIYGAYDQWTESSYDEYGRVSQIQSFTGKTTNITYNGLSVTVNDGTKSVTTTKNALGNTTSVIDPGGTINYTYYANGNLKSSNFDGSEQAIEQDGWGRKTRLTDPSAGVYDYSYNAFGETLTESTPKGITTYVYDAIGKLQSKTVTGSGTNMAYQYTYDGASKLLTNMALSNADGNNANYTYTYDTYKRLQSTIEDNTYAKFTKTFTFDGFGRIATALSQALNKSNNETTSKTVLNTYQYGALKSITDNATSEVIWQVGSVNARGQVTMATMANGNLKQSNTYDQYGFAQELKTERMVNSPAVLMSLGYDFNAQRGILNSRTNSVFASTEVFTHDNQDRLTNFNYSVNNQILNVQSQIYDNKGRISSNSFLGNYVYNGASYQQTALNNATIDAQRNYQDRVRQDISYNAFKSPIEISETGKEKISFQYNASMGRAHRYYGDESADKMQRRYRKHYSEDGSMEITEDTQNGITSFIFYMGGDAYSAPAIWKEIHTASTVSQDLYYLHRDHLGSINLITDNQGVIKEQRQFDAWGNIIKLTDGNGNVLADFVIIDRGYTGHEHLLGVGLIHMNGRLYDPLLHWFLSPDNNIQDPSNTQNFNRYGYVLNNPLSHVDPSGEFWNFIIGAAISVVTNGISNLANGESFFKGAFKAAIFGAVGGAASSAIGGAANTLSGVGKLAFQTLAHGTLGGILSGASGGGFGNGFLAGAFGNLAASGAEGLFRNVSNLGRSVGMVASGTIIGGLSSEISGGSFWDGARNGAITAGLNHLQSALKNKFNDAQLRKMYAIYKNSYSETNSSAEFYESIGGDLGDMALRSPEEFENTCAARLSKALNYSGFEIPVGTPDSYLGGDGRAYFIQAKAMSSYLSGSKMWGTPITLGNNKLRNGVFFQTGFGKGVTGHLDIMYRGDAAHRLYNYNYLTNYYWH